MTSSFLKPRCGMPIVLSAASGTGKTTLAQRLLKSIDNIAVSVSYTTRAPRGKEQHGVEYYFIDQEQFDHMVKCNEFIEWAEVHGNLYGTAFTEVQQRLEQGQDVLLDIDVQGGDQIRQRFEQSLLIFLLPPSMDELKNRLLLRATESYHDVQRRMLNARKEIEAAHHYDYLIVNDDLEQATERLIQVVRAERLRKQDKSLWIRHLLSGQSMRNI